MTKTIGEYLGPPPEPAKFEAWWAIYPRKKGNKKRCEKKYDALSADDRSACYLGTVKHIELEAQWRDNSFVPYPETFLNGRMWENEISLTVRQEAREEAETGDNASMVWSAMLEMYGERWIKEHGVKPGELWHKFLRDIPFNRVKRGLRATLQRNTEHPPSLPKFMEYCAPTFGELHPSAPALPRPEGDPALADDAFQQMYKSIREGKNNAIG